MATTAAVAAGLSLLATDSRAGAVLTPARVFASPDLSGPTARGVQMAPDGSAVTYLKSKPSDVTVTDLWIADVADGTSRLLIDGAALSPKDHTLSEAERSRREREGVAVQIEIVREQFGGRRVRRRALPSAERVITGRGNAMDHDGEGAAVRIARGVNRPARHCIGAEGKC